MYNLSLWQPPLGPTQVMNYYSIIVSWQTPLACIWKLFPPCLHFKGRLAVPRVLVVICPHLLDLWRRRLPVCTQTPFLHAALSAPLTHRPRFLFTLPLLCHLLTFQILSLVHYRLWVLTVLPSWVRAYHVM